MADDTKSGGVSSKGPQATLSNAAEAQARANAAGSKKKSQGMGQQEFLTLLVNQLQHQDPLDPMKSEEFAVQLAQFSSLEQLIKLNQNFESEQSDSPATMASYLGHDVVLKDGPVQITGGRGPNVELEIPEGTQSLRVDLIDKDGQVARSVNVKDVEAGTQGFALNGVQVADGEYTIKVKAVTSEGRFTDLDPKLTGTVEGFVLEPVPALLVGGGQISTSDIVEVRAKAEA